METKVQAHVAPWKLEEVKTLKGLIKSKPVVAIVDMMDVPAPQLQEIRDKIRDKVKLRMSRNTLIVRALNEVAEELNNPKLAELANYVERGAAILVTDMNPFRLYKMLEENKSPAPVRGGQIAPCDIKVEKGSTGMPPGPFLGELKSVGIPAAIEKGKIAIKEDKVVVKKGEVVSPKLAAVLDRLGIKPVKVGLNVLAVYEDGIIYTPDVLKVDEDKLLADIQTAYQNAFNLAFNTAYPAKEVLPFLIQKAFMDARALSIETAFITKETAGDILAKAQSQALALASKLPEDAIDEEIKEKISSIEVSSAPTVEETKEEEKKEEEKKEEDTGAAGLALLF
ncbi:ribosomal protein L10 [Methanocaldococcus vulcanius M7]|uniref:Large ribosomal subunit protein uL10 n=1 Tax=Methanocaldococcus vulcanius (strain ATCC 700851 / DSM 12094 / M7) TaxID=579137 RepID=C9RDQ6_METVM|nr:50S ribosomal protein L10 [Methanocaldococcus vulcanius]ACX73435.1 ribosomal protein L10 [Methanocaldococcus vulcanius M7]